MELTNYVVPTTKFGFWSTIPTFGDGFRKCLETGKVKIALDFLSFGENDVEFADKTVVKDVDSVSDNSL